ncbi:MAG: Uma2 family endonuclease, partial [Acidobacteria bacterium]|nr:Uma2 family endonuclease [Acidobacteriota bacterium]
MAPVQELKPRVGYTDLLHAPDDGRRYELHDGEVIVIPSPLPIHQIVAQRILYVLREYAEKTGGMAIISPIDIVFSEYDVLQPDIVFFSAARSNVVNLRAPIRHPPDLVVEVLSPSTAVRDRGRKLHIFATYG